MSPEQAHIPNPRRVAAGKRNRLLRQGLTPEGRERLRQTALRHQPWRFTTGPKTAAGKARSAQNGKHRQRGPLSLRAVRRAVADVTALVREMRAGRQAVGP